MLMPSNARSRSSMTLRLFSSVRRRLAIDDCTPLSAPTAAHWAGADGPEVCCDWIVAMASIRCALPIAHPMLNPVMAYIFKTPLMTALLACFFGAFANSEQMGALL